MIDFAPGSDSRSQIKCLAKVSIFVVNEGPSSSMFFISASLLLLISEYIADFLGVEEGEDLS